MDSIQQFKDEDIARERKLLGTIKSLSSGTYINKGSERL